MTSCLSDMRTVCSQGPTFHITQPNGLRISHAEQNLTHLRQVSFVKQG
jgi:hypothetical protein